MKFSTVDFIGLKHAEQMRFSLRHLKKQKTCLWIDKKSNQQRTDQRLWVASWDQVIICSDSGVIMHACILLQNGLETLFGFKPSNSDLKKIVFFSLVYGWERFRVLHSDVYLYSKTGNIFVIYIYRCQYITNIFNCFRIKQKTIWHFANLITAVVQSWTLLSLFISIIIIHHGIIWMMFLSALYPTKVNF